MCYLNLLQSAYVVLWATLGSLLPPKKSLPTPKRLYVFVFVCLCPVDNSETYGRIFD